MDGDTVANEKRMRLRYAGTCRICAADLPARIEAVYERSTKTIRCLDHDTPVEVGPAVSVEDVDPGVPGASARREFERRAARHEERIRAAHPTLGGLIHALTEDPPSTTAWDIGALGEERLGHRLNELASDTLLVLHDRRIPGTRANIDHLAVTPSGIYVIDTKRYSGRPRLQVDGGPFRPRVEKLLVGGRDCTMLTVGALKQVDVVRTAIADDDIPVHAVLCFVDADWPLLGGSFLIRDVAVVSPKKLYPLLRTPGSLDTNSIGSAHRTLAGALPVA